MKHCKFILLLFIIMLSSSMVNAEKLMLDSDISVFRHSDGKSIVEIYFSYSQRSLIYVFSDNEYNASVHTRIIINDISAGKVLLDQTFAMNSRVSDTAKQKLLSKLIGQQNFSLSPGSYRIRLFGYDNNKPSSSDSSSFDVVIPVFDNDKTDLSSLQLSTNIEKSSDNNSIFYKNGLEVTPNPNLLFGGNLNKIYYYVEIYNIGGTFISDNVYFITQILDASGNIVETTQKKEVSRKQAFVETGFLPVDSLKTGSYTFKIMLVNVTTSEKIEREKKFYIYNAVFAQDNTTIDNLGFMQSEFVTKSEDALDDEFEKTIYIRNAKETAEYKTLKTLDDKRKFFYSFWKKRDTNPVTPKFEIREEYFKRVSDANKKFRQGFSEGWKSDRGRIYIIYGPPEDIEVHFMEADVKNYEIWTYEYVEGGAKVMFAETSASGEGTYYLVNSTLRNEFQDPNWLAKLKK